MCFIYSPVPKTACLVGLAGRRFGRLWRDSRLYCRTLKTGQLFSRCFTLSCQAPDSCSCFSTRNLVFARINLKPAVLKNFVFDSELCLRLCEVYRFENMVGLELPIKHTLRNSNLRNTSPDFKIIPPLIKKQGLVWKTLVSYLKFIDIRIVYVFSFLID